MFAIYNIFYSIKKFNINGRICLETLIPFGILGVIIMYVTNPWLLNIYEKIPAIYLHVITAILAIIFLVDNIISSNVISSINKEGSKLVKDNTEEITEKVKQILREKSWLHRRLINAYPNLKNIGIIKKIKRKNKKMLWNKSLKTIITTRKMGGLLLANNNAQKFAKQISCTNKDERFKML